MRVFRFMVVLLCLSSQSFADPSDEAIAKLMETEGAQKLVEMLSKPTRSRNFMDLLRRTKTDQRDAYRDLVRDEFNKATPEIEAVVRNTISLSLTEAEVEAMTAALSDPNFVSAAEKTNLITQLMGKQMDIALAPVWKRIEEEHLSRGMAK